MATNPPLGSPAAKPKAKPLGYTILVVLVGGVIWLAGQMGWISSSDAPTNDGDTAIVDAPAGSDSNRATAGDEGADEILELFAQGTSDVILTGEGTVVHILPDDNEGSRHQRLLVDLVGSDGEEVTIKIAHNIDLADRISVEEGDRIRFKGEYEWNDQGGVIHWTHHDPRGKHEDGWLEANGRRVG